MHGTAYDVHALHTAAVLIPIINIRRWKRAKKILIFAFLMWNTLSRVGEAVITLQQVGLARRSGTYWHIYGHDPPQRPDPKRRYARLKIRHKYVL